MKGVDKTVSKGKAGRRELKKLKGLEKLGWDNENKNLQIGTNFDLRMKMDILCRRIFLSAETCQWHKCTLSLKILLFQKREVKKVQ